MNAILVSLGFILLVTGSQMRAIFAGGVGFLVGSLMIERIQIVRGPVDLIVYSLACGVLAALLAVVLKRALTTLAIFIAGLYVCLALPAALGWYTGWISLPVLLGAGAASAAAYALWGEIPAILVSAGLGATLMVQNLTFGSIGATPMFIIALIFGIIAQWVLSQYGMPESK